MYLDQFRRETLSLERKRSRMLTWTAIEFDKCSISTLHDHSQRDERAMVEHNSDQRYPSFVCVCGDPRPEFPKACSISAQREF